MNPNVSLALDVLRLTAAMIVFVGHASGVNWTGGFLWQVAHWMDAAVVLFFVLSGYVISHVVTKRERDWRAYTAARVGRLWSVVLPALLLTFVIDRIGVQIAPHLYLGMPWFNERMPLLQYPASLLLVQNYWGLNLEPGINLPFWSLCNEAAYYAWFGALAFMPRKQAFVAVGVGMLLAGPAISLLFMVWLLGAAMHRVHVKALKPKYSGLIYLAIASALAWIFFRIGKIPDAPTLIGPQFYRQVAWALVAAVGLLGVIGVVTGVPQAPQQFRRAVAWLAAPTFALYLFHRPLIQFFSYIDTAVPTSSFKRVLVFGGTLVVVYLLSPLCERLKLVLTGAISKLLHSFSGNHGAGQMAK